MPLYFFNRCTIFTYALVSNAAAFIINLLEFPSSVMCNTVEIYSKEFYLCAVCLDSNVMEGNIRWQIRNCLNGNLQYKKSHSF